MEYTIGQVSKKLNMSTYTIRYYEKEGLIPPITRNAHGRRIFDENNLYRIDMIRCYRDAGMALKDIKHMIDLANEGKHTLHLRKDILNNHKTKVEKQIEDLQEHLHKMNMKIQWHEGEVTSCPFEGTP
ncbi:MerR family transcriptional regulator [Pontibacillus salipaludis]|uniref:MerR family transcriptional regulator n=1 Tax=Pontibacillus salipaludis TaxID=1697394 RepID=UPI0031EC92EC